MIETCIEIARKHTQVLRETSRIQDLGEPPQPDQAVDAGREIHPAKGHFRRQMHPVVAHGLDRRPRWITAHGIEKLQVDFSSGFHSSTCSIETLASPPGAIACDIGLRASPRTPTLR